MKISWHPCDLPYGCFALAGATILGMALIRASYSDDDWADGAGAIFLLLMPFWMRRERWRRLRALPPGFVSSIPGFPR